MILKPTIGLLLYLCCGVSFAQLGGSPEKTAIKNIEKHRWQKAENKLRKILAKETVSPSARYILSSYYFHPENPSFNLDSAYHYVVTALGDYALSPPRERDRLKRAEVDSLHLIALRAKIDSTAFEVARETNTEAAYLEFLNDFPSAVQRDLAAQLRDEVAYRDALNENTYQAFLDYLTRYPNATRAAEARSHYDRLLFYAKTGDQRLSSFERFLSDHPETPYRREIYRHIFEISTADGTVESFLSFIARYPVSDLVKKAGQMIFHMLAEEEDPRWPGQFLNDSLQNLIDINETYLIPVLNNNLYGFMDAGGREIIPPKFKNIHPDYLCGNILDEILIVEGQLIARNGSPVYQGPVEEVSDLGIGFLKINTGSDTKLIHKAGFILQDSIQDARILSKHFLAIRKNDLWFLHTLTGRLLDARPWQEITTINDVILFSNGKQKYLAHWTQLSKSADGNALPLSDSFDEVEQWSGGWIWGKSGEYQGVLNQSLDGVIRFDKHTLAETFFGATAATPYGHYLYNRAGQRSSTFDQVLMLGQRVAVKEKDSWFLFDPEMQSTRSKAYDSIQAKGTFLLGVLADTVSVHFADNKIQRFFRPGDISFIPGKDSTSFLTVQEGAHRKTVFDLKGTKLFTADFDALEYAGHGIFIITRKDRKGLLNILGESLLPATFDAIGSVKEEVISILKNKRFGAYHIGKRKFIKPQYDRNIVPYAESCVVSSKDGNYGFLGWDNKPLSSFEYEEIRYWNDSVALVKKQSHWSLYTIHTGKVTESNLRNITWIKDSQDEKVAIVQKDKNFGVLHNNGQALIPLTFSDVINLGSSDVPLYFTEKHIWEASLFIVIYYDRFGNMLRKEIYDDPAAYDKIYCSDK